MRVEVTEKKLRDSGYDLVEGDTVKVPNAIGAAWCSYGWARDVSGKTETGPRIPGARVIQPDNSRIAAKKRG